MYYDPRENLKPAPLTHNPFNALVAPRPIGWISSIDAQACVNLAPFSYYNALCADPPYIVFSAGSKDAEGTPKDTLANVQQVPEFVVNVASWDLREQMNQSSKVYPADVNEFEQVGLTQAACKQVRPPRVAEAKAALECKVFQIVELPTATAGRSRHVVIGEVVGIHIDDSLIEDGKIQASSLQPLSRLGYFEYQAISETFSIPRPD